MLEGIAKFILQIVIFFSVGGVVIFVFLRLQKRGLARWAKIRGYSYQDLLEPDQIHSFVESLSWFDLFSEDYPPKLSDKTKPNHRRYRSISHLLQGREGDVEVSIFNYLYDNFGESENHSERVYLFQCDRMNLPQFRIKRVIPGWGKLKELVGAPSQDFPNHRDFTQHYVIDSEDFQSVRPVFKDEVLDFFEQHESLTGFKIYAQDNVLVLLTNNQSVGSITPELELGLRLVKAFSSTKRSANDAH